MIITFLAIHPIKSLNSISLTSSPITSLGLPNDRTFLLLRTAPQKILQISSEPALGLFTVAFSPPPDSTPPLSSCPSDAPILNYNSSNSNPDSYLKITHTPTSQTLCFPLTPSESQLAADNDVEINLYNSTTRGRYLADASIDVWFSTYLGYVTRLVYLPPTSTRPVLAHNPTLSATPSLTSGVMRWIGLGQPQPVEVKQEREITFADTAPLMLVNEASWKEVEGRVRGKLEGVGQEGSVGEVADVRKFRGNIVVGPGEEGEKEGEKAWDEDWWEELKIGEEEGDEVVVQLTANCARCQSLNVDYKTGKYSPPERQVLKLLMRDRRVDKGMKNAPVFGRYGFLMGDEHERKVVRVGDKMKVTKRRQERAIYEWPGLSDGTSR